MIWAAFFQGVPALPGPPPSASTFPQWVWWAGGVLVFGILGLLYLLAQRKQQMTGINRETITGLRDAVAARDLKITDGKTELTDAKARFESQLAEISDDLEQLTTEHTTLIGIDIKELLTFAEKGYQAELARVRHDLDVAETECRRLERDVRHRGSARQKDE